MSRRARVVAVLLLAMAAGCSGLPVVEDGSGITVTPADVPTDEATPTRAGGVPFVEANGSFSDPATLAANHRDTLQGQSFTVSATQTIRFPASNQTGRWELTASIAPSGAFAVDTERGGSVFGTDRSIRIGFWSNGEIVVEAFLRNGTWTANIVRDAQGNPVPPMTVMPIDPYFEGELRTIYAATRVQSMTRTDAGGQSTDPVRLSTAGPVGPGVAGTLASVTAVRNLSATIDITEEGFVTRIRFRYAGEFAGEPVFVTRTVRYTKLGTTTVHRPDWVGDALAGSDYDPSNGTNDSS